MSKDELKVYHNEEVDEQELPELTPWDDILDRPMSLADLNIQDGKALEQVKEDISGLGALAWEDVVTELLIANNAVTNAKIAVNAIQGDVIAANAITSTKIANNAVESAKIKAGAVVAGSIASGAVTTEKLDALAVTTDKIAANAVTAAKITTGELITLSAQIKDAIITDAKISNLSADKITTGTLTGRTIQTGTSGRRIRMISGTPGADLFNTIESMYGNDVVGNLAFGYAYATDSSSFRLAAYGSSVEGNAKSNLGYAGLSIYGGSYYFGLDWYGGSISTARITNNLRIDSDWHPYANNSYSLGSSTYKWKNLYLAGNASIGGNIYVPDNFNVYIDGNIRLNIQDTVSYFQNTVAPWSSNTYNLGASSYRWKNIYLSNDPDVSSSKELKKDIRPTKYGLSEIRRLEPVEFSLLDDDINRIGFIAEDVCKILPEVSSGKSMKSTMLIPVIVKAIQELNQKVNALAKTN